MLTEEEKLRRLAGADVLCAPSLGGESFGMVLLEAMAAGTAVVASDIPGYRDAAGGKARLVPPGDAAALAEALAELLEPVGGTPGRRAGAVPGGSGRPSPGVVDGPAGPTLRGAVPGCHIPGGTLSRRTLLGS